MVRLAQKGNKGSAIAIVFGISILIIGFYFATQSFVSNRETQVLRAIKSFELQEISRETLIKTRENFFHKRASATSSSFTTHINLDKETEIFTFIEERASSQTGFLYGIGKSGRLLDSIHYLTLACYLENCWISAAEEIFSPEPFYDSDSYDAVDFEISLQPKNPVRTLSHFTSLTPAQWKELISCKDLKVRECRIELLNTLRYTNKTAREREYIYEPMRTRIVSNFPKLPEKMKESEVLRLFEFLDNQRTLELNDYYWVDASMKRLETLPEEINPEELSIQEPQNPFSDLAILNQILKIANLKSESPRKTPFQNLFFHDSTHVLSHYIKREKLDEKLYSKPSEFFRILKLESRFKAAVFSLETRCTPPPPKELPQLISFLEGIRSQSMNYTLKDCTEPANFSLNLKENLSAVQESPLLFIKEKPWITLESLKRLIAKSGGAEDGEFLQDPQKNKEEKGQYTLVLPVFE